MAASVFAQGGEGLRPWPSWSSRIRAFGFWATTPFEEGDALRRAVWRARGTGRGAPGCQLSSGSAFEGGRGSWALGQGELALPEINVAELKVGDGPCRGDKFGPGVL